ncbi:hypothetical protein RchiOBHm_Chr6g0280431 [Rosa chinensis]|uniref:Uncharacterized protein n=1 Tax=Rosa chinensis TaxID=74649 RepID=A0A2P6PTC9_ROSCH|nr:hypothetical protein RchiOBHm_Chr6g0280431 [Rosa chinensis]
MQASRLHRDGIFHCSTCTFWLWLNRRWEIRSGDTKDLIRLRVSRSIWVAVHLGGAWTQVQTRIWVTSMAGVLSFWWLSDRPKLMAAPSSWWCRAGKLL